MYNEHIDEQDAYDANMDEVFERMRCLQGVDLYNADIRDGHYIPDEAKDALPPDPWDAWEPTCEELEEIEATNRVA